MPINLASPGILVKEVDLTIGRVDSATDKNAAIVLTAEKGPVNIPVICESEQDLIDNFGKPKPTDQSYENWLVASSYLAYGGVLSVVRASSTNLNNANSANTTNVINSVDDYVNKGYDEGVITGVTIAARNPGTWANNLKVAVVDGFADQILTLHDNGPGWANLSVGVGITQSLADVTLHPDAIPGIGSTSAGTGYIKGIVTGVATASGLGALEIGVKILSHVTYNDNGSLKELSLIHI